MECGLGKRYRLYVGLTKRSIRRGVRLTQSEHVTIVFDRIKFIYKRSVTLRIRGDSQKNSFLFVIFSKKCLSIKLCVCVHVCVCVCMFIIGCR